MEKRTMQLWLRAIITLLIVLITEGHPVDITYLQSAVAKGAVCLDGSPPAYHFDKGFGAGVNNWFIQLETVAGTSHIEQFYSEVVNTHGSAKNLPQSCTSRLKPGLCFFPQNVAQQIQTPLFLVNAAYDSWQIKNILAPGVADPRGTWRDCKLDILKCSSAQLQTMQGFRAEFLKALNSLGPSSTRGYYINSCYAHCQTGTQETWLRDDSPVLAGTTIAKAVGDWYYDRKRFQEIDCPYPCNKTCKNRNFESDSIDD